MAFGILGLAIAALFAGAALYVSVAEHSARNALDPAAQLVQWKPAYARGAVMQASLAVLGFGLGVLAWHRTGDLRWLAGALVLIANWPYTLLVIMPTNRALKATPPDAAGPATRALLARWGHLHAVRTALGGAAMVLFAWAAIG